MCCSGTNYTSDGSLPSRADPSAWFKRWRDSDPRAFSRREAVHLRRQLERVELIGCPRWSEARAGNSAAAASVALQLAWSQWPPDQRSEFALCAVLLCAVEGDVASRFILTAIQDRLRQPVDKDSQESAPPSLSRSGLYTGGRKDSAPVVR